MLCKLRQSFCGLPKIYNYYQWGKRLKRFSLLLLQSSPFFYFHQMVMRLLQEDKGLKSYGQIHPLNVVNTFKDSISWASLLGWNKTLKSRKGPRLRGLGRGELEGDKHVQSHREEGRCSSPAPKSHLDSRSWGCRTSRSTHNRAFRFSCLFTRNSNISFLRRKLMTYLLMPCQHQVDTKWLINTWWLPGNFPDTSRSWFSSVTQGNERYFTAPKSGEV